ncbi:MAG: hypothetical protein J6X33_08110 [Clostridiales bacterium]|nr:hypothetical protein [Clostridiales bacterium]
MAFGIKIFEKDEYLFTLLRQRLGYFFPEAYIMRFSEPNALAQTVTEDERFCEFEKTLFDQRQFTQEDTGDPEAVALFDDKGTIDCQRLSRAIGVAGRITPVNISRGTEAEITVLLSFVYSSEREDYIRKLRTPYDYDIPLRLDFTGGYGLARSDPGNMNELIRLSSSRKFKPEDILAFVHRDDTGFLTPGGTTDPDLIHEIGSSGVIKILKAAKELAAKDPMSVAALAVLESFSSKEMIEISGNADRVIVLTHDVSAGISEFVMRLKRQLPPDTVFDVCSTAERVAEYG